VDGYLLNWCVGLLFGWLFVCLVGRLVGWLVGNSVEDNADG
jgi:hypothetical protein